MESHRPLLVDTCDRASDLRDRARPIFERFRRDQDDMLLRHDLRYGGVCWGGLTPERPKERTDAELMAAAERIVADQRQFAATPHGRYAAAQERAADASYRLHQLANEAVVRPMGGWKAAAPRLLERARELQINARAALAAAEEMEVAAGDELATQAADAVIVGSNVHPVMVAALDPFVRRSIIGTAPIDGRSFNGVA